MELEEIITNLKKEQLTSLDLREQSIKDDTITHLANVLQSNHSLESLDLSINDITAVGAAALAEMLQVNQTLTFLSLANNQIGDEGCIALATTLEVNQTLCYFNLQGNEIGNKGTQALADALKVNKALNSLNLQWNKIADSGLSALIDSFKFNQILTSLNVNWNAFDNNSLMLYTKAWKIHQTEQQDVLTAAEEGDEHKLTAFVQQHQVMPNRVLNLLIKHQHTTLVMKWEKYWSLAAYKLKDSLGNTPLHTALLNKNEILIKWLLSKKVCLTTLNEKNQTALDLLKKSAIPFAIYKVGSYYLNSENIKEDRKNALYWYEKAQDYKPAIWLIELIRILGKATHVESIAIEKIALENLAFPVLTPEEMNEVLQSITLNGKLIPSLSKEENTIYHLAALFGAGEWLKNLQTLNLNKLLLRKNYRNASPSSLICHQIELIAEFKGIALNSATADLTLQRYYACERSLNQIEEALQLDLLTTANNNHIQAHHDYEAKTQELKKAIAALAWQPENINAQTLEVYVQLLKNIWQAKQQLIAIDTKLKNHIVWPKGFSIQQIESPAEIILAWTQSSSFFVKMKAPLLGPMVYLSAYCTELEQWANSFAKKSTIKSTFEQEHNQIQQAFTQLIEAYKTFETLYETSISEETKNFLLSTTPILLLSTNSSPMLINQNDASAVLANLVQKKTQSIYSMNNVCYTSNPHTPAINFMVDALEKILIEKHPTPVELVKLINDEGYGFIYQASHIMKGKNLQNILLHHPEYLVKLNLESFTSAVLTGLLTDIQDGKADNYLVDFTLGMNDELNEINIVAIDTNLAFPDTLFNYYQSGKQTKATVNVKNSLYFFPQMKQAVDPTVREKLLRQPPEFILSAWLHSLLIKNQTYQQAKDFMTTKEYHGEADEGGLELPIKIAMSTIIQVYDKLIQLHKILIEQPNLSLWELLATMQPEVAHYYAKIKQQYPDKMLGCNILQCTQTLYEDNTVDNLRLQKFSEQSQQNTEKSRLSSTTSEAKVSIADGIIFLLGIFNYDNYKGQMGVLLYQKLHNLIQEAGLDNLINIALAHNNANCIYWIWHEKLIDGNSLKEQCENLKKYSLLHFFTQNKHFNGVKVLLEENIYPVNVTNGQGYTPLHMAASVGDYALVEYLVHKGAHTRVKTILNKTPLKMAETRCQQMNKQAFQTGDKKYADVITFLKKAESTLFTVSQKSIPLAENAVVEKQDNAYELKVNLKP